MADVMEPKGVHDLNRANLTSYLAKLLNQNLSSSLVVKQFKAGQSNPTYYVKFGETELVLRKKPPGQLLYGAHQIGREYKVMDALYKANFPVPRMIGYCKDSTVLGTEFFVMEFLGGRVLSQTMVGLTAKERVKCIKSATKTLAKLHSFNPVALGLDDFGKTTGFCSRVLNTWSKQYYASAHKDIPQMKELITWLTNKLPNITEESSIIHGDYSLNNVMFHPIKSRVLAVLDWELSTIGHPLMDFAYLCLIYHAPTEYFLVQQVDQCELKQLFKDLPSEEELVKYYCKLRGISYPIPNWNFYLSLNFFKLSAIVQGVYSRHLKGNASSPNAAIYEALVTPLIQRALDLTKIEPQTVNMSLSPSPKGKEVLEKVKKFLKENCEANEKAYNEYVDAQNDPFCVVPLMEEIKAKAKQEGLWNLFLPDVSGLSNVDYAHIAEQLGRSVMNSEALNCSAPDTGNMEVLHMYGSDYQKRKWLQPLLEGKIRSAFCMTEPQVASSDATNMETTITRDGDSYVVNG
uniref:Aminoglycoside phosphotransferase domain-containing protein n=1 Tax=Ciona savignyi TaxID=51511 RepID=H2ZGM9_CIOSA